MDNGWGSEGEDNAEGVKEDKKRDSSSVSRPGRAGSACCVGWESFQRA